jgi:glyoxylase-like metal-dependent hydrolase (beta-lactamase superfamily II)
MTIPTYEVYAIRYAWRPLQRKDNFLGGDPHEGPMPMDYFVWCIRNAERTFVVDVGFTEEVGNKRKRTYLHTPRQGLAKIGVDTTQVKDVIISHMHYDHAGTLDDFPNAQFHIQDDEMAYATGRYMGNHQFSHGIEVEDVLGMVRRVFKNRVTFHRGTEELAPGVSVHRIGGHTAGLQSVRVHTKRGWMVLASDASHYYEHIETERFFRSVFNIGEMLDGYRTLRSLAESINHIIPGHDPLVMKRYPAASPELEGIVARLDEEPRL